MPDLSVVYLTYRPGGIDLLVDSLLRQLCEFELIVVDGYVDRVTRGVAAGYILAHGLPLLYYGPPKVKSFPDTPLNLANAMNTAALVARTRRLIFCHDFVSLPPGVLVSWRRAFDENGTKALITGMADIYQSAPPDVPAGDVSIWSEQLPLKQRLLGKPVPWQPEEFENFFCGVSMEFVETIGGFDERADAHIGWTVQSMTHQAKLNGYRLVPDRELVVNMVDHHSWGGGQWHAQEIDTGLPKTMDAFNMSPAWGRWSQNPYDFRRERALLQGRIARGENHTGPLRLEGA